MTMNFRALAGAASLIALLAGGAHAACTIEGAGSVRILSNDFDALRIVNDTAAECASDAVKVTANASAEHKNIQGPALAANPAEYTVAVVANNSIVPLLSDDLIRPLDDLVAKYGASLAPNQLIKIDGKVMAIAFMGNGQHMFYRKDILEKAGRRRAEAPMRKSSPPPRRSRTPGLMEYPLAASNKPGWDLAAEFVNMYLGTGGEFFAEGSAELAIDNDNGRKVLDTMRAMTGFMNPDYLTYRRDRAQQALGRRLKVAIMTSGARWPALRQTRPPRPIPKLPATPHSPQRPPSHGGSDPRPLPSGGTVSPSPRTCQRRRRRSLLPGHGQGRSRPEMAAANPTRRDLAVAGLEPGPAAVGRDRQCFRPVPAPIRCSPIWVFCTRRCRPNWPTSSPARKRPIRPWPTSRPPMTPLPKKAAS